MSRRDSASLYSLELHRSHDGTSSSASDPSATVPPPSPQQRDTVTSRSAGRHRLKRQRSFYEPRPYLDPIGNDDEEPGSLLAEKANGNHHATNIHVHRNPGTEDLPPLAMRNTQTATAAAVVASDQDEEPPIMVELRTNVLISDENAIISDLSLYLAAQYTRPARSVLVSIEHTSTLALAGSLDPCYVLNITSFPSAARAITPKVATPEIQSFMSDTLGVSPGRGSVVLHSIATDGAEETTKPTAAPSGVPGAGVSEISSPDASSDEDELDELSESAAVKMSQGSAGEEANRPVLELNLPETNIDLHLPAPDLASPPAESLAGPDQEGEAQQHVSVPLDPPRFLHSRLTPGETHVVAVPSVPATISTFAIEPKSPISLAKQIRQLRSYDDFSATRAESPQGIDPLFAHRTLHQGSADSENPNPDPDLSSTVAVLARAPEVPTVHIQEAQDSELTKSALSSRPTKPAPLQPRTPNGLELENAPTRLKNSRSVSDSLYRRSGQITQMPERARSGQALRASFIPQPLQQPYEEQKFLFPPSLRKAKSFHFLASNLSYFDGPELPSSDSHASLPFGGIVEPTAKDLVAPEPAAAIDPYRRSGALPTPALLPVPDIRVQPAKPSARRAVAAQMTALPEYIPPPPIIEPPVPSPGTGGVGEAEPVPKKISKRRSFMRLSLRREPR